MKTNALKKNKKDVKSPEDKFVSEEKYTDRGTVYDDDPNLDVPEFTDDDAALLPGEAEEEINPFNKKEEDENI